MDAKVLVSFPLKEAKTIIYKHIFALLQMQVGQILPQGGKLTVDSGYLGNYFPGPGKICKQSWTMCQGNQLPLVT